MGEEKQKKEKLGKGQSEKKGGGEARAELFQAQFSFI